MDLETTIDILTESCTHLAEAKSHGLTCTLICEVLQVGKCWEELKGILWLKFCYANIHTYTSSFIEIQQRNNETCTAYVHHFKTASKQCTFDNDTAAIHIFFKGLWNAHITAAKIYKKDPQTWSEVIRIVEKFNATQQLTAMLTPSMVSMMSNNDRCFVCGQMGHFGSHFPSAQCYSCDEFGHFRQDCLNKIPLSGTPCQQDRSHSRPLYTHTLRARSHCTHYGHRHGRHFN